MTKIKIRMNYGKREVIGEAIHLPFLPKRKFYLHKSDFSIYGSKHAITESKSGIAIGRGDTEDEAYLCALCIAGFYTEKIFRKDIKSIIEKGCLNKII